jgi:AcrR family transcriptional regulator
MAQKRPYHHGNLRDAALALALSIVDERGHESLSVRDIATEADVTPMALYRHFGNRSSLLAAVAGVAMEHLFKQHKKAIRGQTDPWDKLDRTMRAFIKYVDAHPNLFRLVYDPAIAAAPEFEDEYIWQRKSYESLLVIFAEALPNASARVLRLRQIAMWSTLFGYATIRATGTLRPYMVEDLSEAEIIASVVERALGPKE